MSSVFLQLYLQVHIEMCCFAHHFINFELSCKSDFLVRSKVFFSSTFVGMEGAARGFRNNGTHSKLKESYLSHFFPHQFHFNLYAGKQQTLRISLICQITVFSQYLPSPPPPPPPPPPDLQRPRFITLPAILQLWQVQTHKDNVRTSKEQTTEDLFHIKGEQEDWNARARK